MLKDKNQKKARSFSSSETHSIRYFLKPTSINWNALDYTQLINLSESSNIWEPAIFREISLLDLNSFQIPKYPNHTQPVERAIKVSSREAQTVASQHKRNANQIIRHELSEKKRKVD